jgi:hypothetical protein
MMRTIFILAGNEKEFRYFVEHETYGFDKRCFVYIGHPRQLRGRLFSQIIILDSF